MAISIGDALLKIGVDADDLDRDMQKAVKKLKGQIKVVGVAMTAMGTAIVAGFALAVKSAVEFETAMREVNTMIGLSQAEFEAFSKEVDDLATDLGIDAVEAAEALYQAISAGIPKENVLEFLQIATKAAIGGVTDTKTAVDGLTTVINAFKLPISDAQKVADIMFTTVKGGKTTFEELSAAMFNVAPIAAAAGISFEEVSAAIATMTKQGVPTKIATTQLRAAMQQLLKPTAEMIKLSEELGISFFNETEASQRAKDALGPLSGAIDIANIAFDAQSAELDELALSYQKTTAAMGVMAEELDDLGDQQTVIRLKIRKLRFAAAQEGRELTDAEKKQISELELSIESLGISYAELSITQDNAAEAAKRESEVLSEAVAVNNELKAAIGETEAALQKGIEAYQNSDKELKTFEDIMAIISDTSGLTTSKIIEMFSSIEAGAGILALTGENAEAFTKDLEAMRSAEGAAEAAFREMEESFSRNASELKAVFSSVTRSIGNVLLPILKQIVEGIKPIIESIKNWISEHPGLTKVIVIVVAALGGLMLVLGPLLLILPALTTALGLFGITLNLSLWPILAVVAAIASVIAIGILVVKNWDWVKEKAIAVWTAISNFFKRIWNNIAGFFKDNWEKILAILFPPVGIAVLIAKNWDKVVDFFKGMWDNIKGIFATSINWIIDRINSLIGLINKVPGIDIGEIGKIGEMPRASLRTPQGMADMMVREPSRLSPGAQGGFQTANITIELDKRTISEVLGQQLVNDIRLRQGVRL